MQIFHAVIKELVTSYFGHRTLPKSAMKGLVVQMEHFFGQKTFWKELSISNGRILYILIFNSGSISECSAFTAVNLFCQLENGLHSMLCACYMEVIILNVTL